jgi:CheY-like chemotaxis protein
VLTHNGRVWVDSEGEGQGATFRVRLPVLLTENQLPDHLPQASRPLEAEPLIGLKILAIDNDPTMLTFVSVALRQAGAEVIEAESAIAALEALQHYQPDLVISGIGMPEYDGYTLIRHLRSSDCDCSPALSRHKYAGKDFKIPDDESVECPAGHRMYRREIRYTRRGDMQMLFSMNPRICASCPVKQHCLSNDSKNTNGRQISVM